MRRSKPRRIRREAPIGGKPDTSLGRSFVPASSSSRRASPMSRNLRRTSFCRHRRSNRRIESGVSGGRSDQSGSLSRMAATMSEREAPVECRPAGQHLEQHAAKRPHVRSAIDLTPRACSGLMYGAVPIDRTGRGDKCRGLPDPASSSSDLARPKSSTFATPPEVILMLAGFRSRWMTPRSCAASSAAAICAAKRTLRRRSVAVVAGCHPGYRHQRAP